jgi:feruloyl-CoA synthase
MHLFDIHDALLAPRTHRESRRDGSFVLSNPMALQPYARCVGDWLDHWAATTPDALFLAERNPSGAWDQVSYANARRRVGRIAQALLNLRLPAGKPVVIVSDNSIDHALLALAAMHVGLAPCTVSSAYTRLSKDAAKIHAILDLLDPALVYASDAGTYGEALRSWHGAAKRVFSTGAELVPGACSFETLQSVSEEVDVANRFAAIRPDDVAKYLLTSGSTGTPKVVVNSHRMLCANQQQIAQVWPFLGKVPLVLLDWLPWSHTFGANHNFNMVLAHGGTLYIDEGRPAPGLVERTLANLRDVQPNFYFNVPRGFDMLLPFLEQDKQAAREVFANLEAIFYAGAALPQSTWQRLEQIARGVKNSPVWFTSAWGSTETAPAVTSVHWFIERAGCIGLPLPGSQVKFVPNGDKFELRVKGPQVFSEYRGAAALTTAAFDDDGFYRIGDAGTLIDVNDPSKGIGFDGRVGEDFKLSTGTWVSVGLLRLKAIAAMSPYVADAVVTGHDRSEIGLLLFLSQQGREADSSQLVANLQQALVQMSVGTGSSQAPRRALVLEEPLSMDAGEITDKGYINQRAVLGRRTESVLALYSATPDPRVMTI